jgi:hypothetical protein
LKLVKLNFKNHFDAEEDENNNKEENIKNSVASHEIKTIDFVQGPILLDGHWYHSFIDIGFNIVNENRATGIEENRI